MRYILILFLFISCKQVEPEVTPYGLYEPAEDTIFTDSIKIIVPNKMYSYLVFTTVEPTYEGQVKNQYITEIDSTANEITEDTKYKILDEAESNLRDAELNDVENSHNESVKILSRDLMVFKNYKDASISRQEKLNYNFELNK